LTATSLTLSITYTCIYTLRYPCATQLHDQQDRVAAGIKKLKEARKKGGQMRMDSFFKAKPVAEGSGSSSGAKRKPEPAKKGSAKGGAKGTKGKAPAAKKAKK
jgi:hypothetical protein